MLISGKALMRRLTREALMRGDASFIKARDIVKQIIVDLVDEERDGVEELHLPMRTENALKRAGFSRISEVRGLTDKELAGLPGVGGRGLALIRGALGQRVEWTEASSK